MSFTFTLSIDFRRVFCRSELGSKAFIRLTLIQILQLVEMIKSSVVQEY